MRQRELAPRSDWRPSGRGGVARAGGLGSHGGSYRGEDVNEAVAAAVTAARMHAHRVTHDDFVATGPKGGIRPSRFASPRGARLGRIRAPPFDPGHLRDVGPLDAVALSERAPGTRLRGVDIGRGER